MSVDEGSAVGVVVVRPRRVRRVAVPAAVVLVAVFTVAGVLLRDTPTGAVFRISDQVAMIVLGIVLGAAALLLTRPRLRADAEGLEIRNVVTTHRYPWDLVLSVSFPEGAPWARLDLPEDEYVPIMAIQVADGTHAVRAMRSVRQLRRRLDNAESTEDTHQ